MGSDGLIILQECVQLRPLIALKDYLLIRRITSVLRQLSVLDLQIQSVDSVFQDALIIRLTNISGIEIIMSVS